jgi:hypothetical protein
MSDSQLYSVDIFACEDETRENVLNNDDSG